MSDTVQDRYGKKVPWILGKNVRIPRINYPVYREGQMSLPSPGRSLVLILTYILMFFLVAGGIYMIINDPITVGGDASGNAIWIYPQIGDAFIIESLAAAFIIYVAGLGFFFIYQSTKHAYNYSYAIKIYIMGIVFAIGGFILLQLILFAKTN